MQSSRALLGARLPREGAHLVCGVDICAVLHQVLDNLELATPRGVAEGRGAVLMERRAQGKHRR